MPEKNAILQIVNIILSLVGVSGITWALGTYFTAKADQQKQLDGFVNSLAKLIIEDNLYSTHGPQAETSRGNKHNRTSIDQSKQSEKLTGESPQFMGLVPSLKGQIGIVLPESAVARAYALNTLANFDGPLPFTSDIGKKQTLLKFLYEFQLLGYCDNLSTSGNCFPYKISLADSNLARVNFAKLGKKLEGITILNANLQRTNFENISIAKSSFQGSDLRSATLSKADLRDTNFSGAYLQNANFNDSILEGSNFSDAQLCGADFTSARNYNRVNFDNVYIDSSTKLPANQKKHAKFVKKCVEPVYSY